MEPKNQVIVSVTEGDIELTDVKSSTEVERQLPTRKARNMRIYLFVILAVLIAFVLALITLASAPLSINTLFTETSTSDTYFSKAMMLSEAKSGQINDHSSWMSALPDTTRFTDINIPGTHDSTARYGGDTYICNSLSLSDQLTLGIRFFDIRVFAGHGTLKCQHGHVYQHIDFQDVLSVMSTFLSVNPSETVFVKIQQEHSQLSAGEFGPLIDKVLVDAPNVFNASSAITAQTIPLLGDLRGQMVLVPRFFDLELNTVPYEVFTAQDEFKVGLVAKSKAITSFYNVISDSSVVTPIIVNTTDSNSVSTTTTGTQKRRRRRAGNTAVDAAAQVIRTKAAKGMGLTWYINYFSLHNNVESPRSAAYTLNPLIANLLSNATSALTVDPDSTFHQSRSIQHKKFGVVMMDFMGPASAKLIIDSNF